MIVLLLVTAIAISLVVQVAVLSLSSVELDNEYAEGLVLINRAEGYLENAALRFLRDPNYLGETINEDNIACTSEISDVGGEKDLVCYCQRNQRIRKVGMTAVYNNGVYDFSKIQERE